MTMTQDMSRLIYFILAPTTTSERDLTVAEGWASQKRDDGPPVAETRFFFFNRETNERYRAVSSSFISR